MLSWFRRFQGRRRADDARRMLSSRASMSLLEFVNAANIPHDSIVEEVARLVRTRLAEVSGLRPDQVYPHDRFEVELADVLDWPEFECSIDLSLLERAFGRTANTRSLDEIVDPSSPGRRGTVAELVVDFVNMLGHRGNF